ncbi:MAG: hypothetical protein M1816_007319 [Peltula sp. TS41687]|nr:MAG: hypothetical protein M1816_007319 [Peltula sp. TS41687]
MTAGISPVTGDDGIELLSIEELLSPTKQKVLTNANSSLEHMPAKVDKQPGDEIAPDSGSSRPGNSQETPIVLRDFDTNDIDIDANEIASLYSTEPAQHKSPEGSHRHCNRDTSNEALCDPVSSSCKDDENGYKIDLSDGDIDDDHDPNNDEQLQSAKRQKLSTSSRYNSAKKHLPKSHHGWAHSRSSSASSTDELDQTDTYVEGPEQTISTDRALPAPPQYSQFGQHDSPTRRRGKVTSPAAADDEDNEEEDDGTLLSQILTHRDTDGLLLKPSTSESLGHILREEIAVYETKLRTRDDTIARLSSKLDRMTVKDNVNVKT